MLVWHCALCATRQQRALVLTMLAMCDLFVCGYTNNARRDLTACHRRRSLTNRAPPPLNDCRHRRAQRIMIGVWRRKNGRAAVVGRRVKV